MLKLIIGLGNKAQNGKDTCGEAIVNYYKTKRNNMLQHGLVSKAPTCRIYKFAAALYDECRQLHGMTVKDAPLLQRVGQARREENPNYWIDKVREQLDRSLFDVAIITDMRYRNEAAAIKEWGGVTVNVTRLNPDGTQFIDPSRPADHPSEIELDGYNFDHYITSKSSVLAGEYAITLAEYLNGALN